MADITQMERLTARRAELILEEKKAFAERTEAFPISEKEREQLLELLMSLEQKMEAYQSLEQTLKEQKNSQKLLGEIKSVLNGHFKEEQQRVHEIMNQLPELLDQMQEAEQAVKEYKEKLYRKYRMELHGGSFTWAKCAERDSGDVVRQAIGAEQIFFEEEADGAIWLYAGKDNGHTRALGYCKDKNIYHASGEICGFYKITKTGDWAAVYQNSEEIIGWVRDNGLLCLDSYCGEKTVEIGGCSAHHAFECGSQYLLFLNQNLIGRREGM